MINAGANFFFKFITNFINISSVYYTTLYLLRLNSIMPCINLFIDFLISYLFRIFLNGSNKCSHASGDVGSTII
jgi:hypothetical protein